MIDLKHLWEIQLLDQQRKSLESSFKGDDMASELRALKNDIEESRAAFKTLKEEYGSLKKELRKREMDTDELKERVGAMSKRLYDGSITSAKEVQSSNQKLLFLQDEIKRTEDLTLATMESLEAVRQKLEKLSAELNEKALHYRRLHGTYLGHQQKMRKMLAQIPQLRQKLLEKVDSNIWKKYVEMKKKIADPLARVEKGACTGCRVGLSFNDLRALKQGGTLVYCQNCGRMLFWER
ncbi:MAG: hypothetical protein K6U04_04200 [Armatimonadetes bacterium]|nr:hypothetical protein [Armatimonadota bacterium]